MKFKKCIDFFHLYKNNKYNILLYKYIIEKNYES